MKREADPSLRGTSRYRYAKALAVGSVNRTPDAITVSEDAVVVFKLGELDGGASVEITITMLSGRPELYSPLEIVSVSAGQVIGLYF